MSIAFDNSQIRQATIWIPFKNYGFYNDGQKVERAIIFGLYSNSYRNNDLYLQGISDIEMAALLADFNIKLAGLSTDKQKTVIDITAKRYVTGVETLIHDEKMVTELQKINADSDEWDAKIAALSTDRAALETLRVKIAAETKKINARILELQAYIQLEVVNLAMIDVEIAEKNLILSGKDLELVTKALEESRRDIAILQVANEIAKIQLQIVEAGLELVDVDMKVSKTRIDIVQTENQIAKAGMAESELTVAIARTTAEQADLATYDSKVVLAGMQVISVNKEIDSVITATSDALSIQQAKLDGISAKQIEHMQAITDQTEKTLFGIADRDAYAKLEKAITEKTNVAQIATDLDKIKVQDSHVEDVITGLYAALRAAEIMATADVASTLTHTIKKNN